MGLDRELFRRPCPAPHSPPVVDPVQGADEVVGYVLRRLGPAVLAPWGTVTVVFIALRLTGSPAQLLAGPNATAIEIARITAQLGLTRPLWSPYGTYLGQALQGNLGFSYVQGAPALGLVLDQFPNTI